MLGRFELLTLLSVGGMAEIYLARSEGIAGFEKLVVVKRMLPHLSMQHDFVEMFLAEARLAAMLDHPNVAQVHDIGEDTGNYYYAMELIRGTDLRQLMKAQSKVAGGVPFHIAIAIGLGMCAGLEHAHELRDHLGAPLGVVHRDVSLSNVMVSYDGTVKITDFGVAKLTSNDARTRTGTLKGKIGYMSPEQCRGEQLDRRSDVFAIGIILYELVTGRRLFRPDGSEFAILQKIIREDATPPSQYRPDIPAGLEGIIMLALQRDRRLRYQTARDMQRDLESLAREQRLPASPIELGEYVRALVPQKPLQIEASRRSSSHTRSKIEVPSGLWGHTTADDDFGIPLAEATEEADLRATPGLGAPALPEGRKPTHRPPITMPMRALDKHKVAIALLGAALAGVFFAIVGVLALRGTEPARQPAPAPVVIAAPVQPVAPATYNTAAAAAPRIAHGIEDALAAAVVDVEVDAGEPLESDMPTRPARSVRPVSDDHRGARRPREDERRPARVPARAAAPRQARIAADPNPAPAPAAEPSPPPAAEPAPIDAGVRPAATEPPVDAAPPAPRPTAPKPAPAPPSRIHDPGSMDAVATISAIDVSGPIQDSEILRGLERVVGSFRECYRDAARAAKKTPAGKVKLSFQIDSTRAARKISASGAPLPGLGSCIEDAAGSIRTRIAPDVGNARVKVTITFAPTGS